MNRIIKRIIKLASVLVIVLCVVCETGVAIAHSRVFSRCEMSEYNTKYYYTYDEIDKTKYPREKVTIKSGDNTLDGNLYNPKSKKGLIIVSPGHRDYSEIKLPEIMSFVDHGFAVLSYDYTGCYASGGNSMVGYVQAPKDLNAVLNFVENKEQFKNMPVFLFGHSLGAYASTAVLNQKHNVKAVVAASGFDDPKEQWNYSIRRYTGVFGNLLAPFADLYMDVRFGSMAHYSAIDGINKSDIPVLLISGTDDEFYGKVSSIYVHQDKITNKNCKMWVMSAKDRHGHYDYFLSEEGKKYQKSVDHGEVKFPIDKFLYMEHDEKLMNDINEFFEDNL